MMARLVIVPPEFAEAFRAVPMLGVCMWLLMTSINPAMYVLTNEGLPDCPIPRLEKHRPVTYDGAAGHAGSASIREDSSSAMRRSSALSFGSVCAILLAASRMAFRASFSF